MFEENNLKKILSNLKDTDIELKRQISCHYITYIACNKQLTICPIVNANNILNLGAGYGVWSYEILKQFSTKTVINVNIEKVDIHEVLRYYYDLSNNIKIENINFKKESLNANYIKYNTIDFLYQRDLLIFYKKKEWKNIIKEIYKILKPEGYVEFVEFDFIIKNEVNAYENVSKKSKNITNITKSDDFNKFFIDNYISVNDLLKIIEKNIKINDVKKIKLNLYGNNDFENFLVENLINNIVKYKLEKKYKEILDQEKIIVILKDYMNALKSEWKSYNSYITLYIICCQKI